MNKNNLYAWLIGIGIILFAIHNPNQPFIRYTFLPQVGMVITILGVIYCLMDNRKSVTFGSKYIWIPLSLITLSIMISSIWEYTGGNITIMETLTPMVFGLILFGLYLVSRILGDAIFRPFIYIVILEAVSCVVFSVVGNHWRDGGIASPTNYDMGAGLLLFGVVVSAISHRWWLSAVALVGLFFTGAEEGIFAVGVLALAVLIRRDWSLKIWLPIGAIVLTIVLCTAFGITAKIYYPTAAKVAAVKEATQDMAVGRIIDKVIPEPIKKPIVDKINEVANNNPAIKESKGFDKLLDIATGTRWLTHWRISPIKPFGYGYNINEFYVGIPHNVVLIIIEQVGILAAIAWLFAVGYCLVKTKWRYAFIMVVALGIFDHYIWSMAAPWFWVTVGVATTSTIKTDLMFKKLPQKVEVLQSVEIENRLKRIREVYNGGSGNVE